VSNAKQICHEIRAETRRIGENGETSHATGIVNNMQRCHQSLREIQNFGTFAMCGLGKLNVKLMKIIEDLRGESVLDQAERSAGL
jgi:hypothetical protein